MVDSVTIGQTIKYVISNKKMISRKFSLPYRKLKWWSTLNRLQKYIIISQ